MPSYVPPKINTGLIDYVALVSQANTLLFQTNPTIASGDFKVSTDGGALASLGTLPTVTPSSSKSVKYTLSAAECNGDNVVVIASDQAGSEWCDRQDRYATGAQQINDLFALGAALPVGAITALGIIDNGVATAASATSLTLRTGKSCAAHTLAGRALWFTGLDEAIIINDNTGATPSVLTFDAPILAPSGTPNYVISVVPNQSTTNLPAVSVAAILGTLLTETVPGYLAAAFKKFYNLVTPTATLNDITDIQTKVAVSDFGTAQAGAAGTITLRAGAPAVKLDGQLVQLTGGTGAGQVGIIAKSGYDTATKIATMVNNWPSTPPDATSTYTIRPLQDVFAEMKRADTDPAAAPGATASFWDRLRWAMFKGLGSTVVQTPTASTVKSRDGATAIATAAVTQVGTTVTKGPDT